MLESRRLSAHQAAKPRFAMASFISSLTVLASVIAAILAWIAKIRWSREFREAKEAQIQTLREQIAKLEKLSPPALLSWVESLEQIAQKQVASLETQLKQRDEDVRREYQGEIEHLVRQDDFRYEIIREAEKQRDEARAALEATKASLEELQRAHETSKNLFVRGTLSLSDSIQAPRPRLITTLDWEPEEAEVLLGIYHLARRRLQEVNAGDEISEGRVQRLEGFINRLKGDAQFARRVFDEIQRSSVYSYDPFDG